MIIAFIREMFRQVLNTFVFYTATVRSNYNIWNFRLTETLDSFMTQFNFQGHSQIERKTSFHVQGWPTQAFISVRSKIISLPPRPKV